MVAKRFARKSVFICVHLWLALFPYDSVLFVLPQTRAFHPMQSRAIRGSPGTAANFSVATSFRWVILPRGAGQGAPFPALTVEFKLN
jgi:hypothetical protein